MKKRIRGVEIGDAAAVRDIYLPFVADSATSFEVVPPTVSEMEGRIEGLRDQYPWLVFETDERVLGYAYATSHRTRLAYQWCVEVSVYVHSSARHCGVGRALYTALFEILRRQGYVNAYAGITLPNAASVALHESLGFTPIGVFQRVGFKLASWHDVFWLQLRLSEEPTPIPKPLPASGLFREAHLAALLQECAHTVKLT